jgi:Zinc-binding dehydrogenase
MPGRSSAAVAQRRGPADGGRGAEDRPCHRRPPGADEPRDPDDLARAHLEADVLEVARQRQPLDLEGRRPRPGPTVGPGRLGRRGGAWREHLPQRAPDHATDDLLPGGLSDVPGQDVLAVLEHRHPVGQLEDVAVIGISRSQSKLELSRDLGADLAVDARAADVAARVGDATGGRGADVVIECAGRVSTLAQAVRLARLGGQVM